MCVPSQSYPATTATSRKQTIRIRLSITKWPELIPSVPDIYRRYCSVIYHTCRYLHSAKQFHPGRAPRVARHPDVRLVVSCQSVSWPDGAPVVWIGDEPAGMSAMNRGTCTTAPPGIGTRIRNDTISSSRRCPRRVSISSRPGIHRGLDNHAKPRSIDSTRFMGPTIPGEKYRKTGENLPCVYGASVALHHNDARKDMQNLSSEVFPPGKISSRICRAFPGACPWRLALVPARHLGDQLKDPPEVSHQRWL